MGGRKGLANYCSAARGDGEGRDGAAEQVGRNSGREAKEEEGTKLVYSGGDGQRSGAQVWVGHVSAIPTVVRAAVH